MQDHANVRVDLDEIRLGATCKYDIHDENGILLLGNGRPFTDVVRDQILERGVSFLEVSSEDAKALRGEKHASVQSQRRAQSSDALPKLRLTNRGTEPHSEKRAAAMRQQVASAIGAISNLGQQIDGISNSAVHELCGIPKILLAMVEEDSDQSLLTTCSVKSEDHLARRCARMSLLAISTAIELEMSEAEVIQAGTAGLLHDLGLYRFPDNFRDPRNVLTPDEAWEYRRHPTMSVNAVSMITSISDETRMIIHQVHERPDGSGYPRGIRSNVIHPVASILSIVDVYLSLTDPGPDRPGYLPHDALIFMLHECGRRMFDAGAMRAFLNQITLYPIGSQVELDNGTIATVMRRCHSNYATPVVLAEDDRESPIELATSERTIARPIIDDKASQVRITKSMMDSMSIEMLEPALG
ncbi:MAG: HD domain-containing phosphohydrolase [Rubripirellula sp.]